MSNFWSTDIGKAIGHAIHEQNSSIGSLKYAITLIKRELQKAEDEKDMERVFELLDDMAPFFKRQQKGMDYAYQKIKEIVVEEQNK